ncbi:TIGR04255 family protein [Methanobrevibacter gottschalkii]|uniref:TIGR04255 family protein n=1 Tax=Methanobrevibacter gottschalkii TaxID=190974 RepID=A0A1H7PD40_9EURY|nr:TIGR04255 family protein [Methanobrevibacter gottschalkii]MCQ2971484.1 TIGR04255 family protein [archaeon]SEL33569.1 TIGR04255 family protein [Methanobrevibacter gottschalkii]
MEKGIRLDEHFISQVIFRIEFPTIKKLTGNDKEVVKDFANKISGTFPISEVIPHNKINLDIDINSGQPPKITREGDLVWIFKNQNAKKIVTLTANDLVLEYRDRVYSGFTNFLDEILLLMDAFNQFDYQKLNFLGLRYINQITDKNVNNNVSEFFSPDLTNMAIINNLEKNNENLVQIFTKVNFKKDDYLMTMQYGLFNPRFPNVDADKMFILDYDCVLHNISHVGEIKDNLIDMNHLIFDKFDYSITAKFEKIIKGE